MGLSWRRMFQVLKFQVGVCLGSVAGVAGGEGGRDWKKEPRVLWAGCRESHQSVHRGEHGMG